MAYIADTFRKTIDDTDSISEGATNKFATQAELDQIGTNQSDITDLQTNKINTSEKGAVNGVATLDGTGKIPSGQVPAIALTDVYVVADIAARDALSVQEGDVAKVLDNGSGVPETYIYDGAAWVSLKSDDAVDSVNGQTGTVSLNIWSTIQSDSGNTSANAEADTLTIAGGTNVSTSVSGDTLTIAATADSQNFTSQNANYTITATDYYVKGAPSGTITYDLPTAVGATGRAYEIKNAGATGTDKIIVDPNAAETIDGAATYTINKDDAIKIVSDGSNWLIF